MRMWSTSRPIVGDITVTNTGTMLLVRGPIKTTIAMDCNRCLDSVRVPIEADIEEQFDLEEMDDSQHHDKVVKIVEEENIGAFEDKILRMDVLIRQATILVEPLMPLCREDCPGIAVKSYRRGRDPRYYRAAQEVAVQRPLEAARRVSFTTRIFSSFWSDQRSARGGELSCHCQNDDILTNGPASAVRTTSWSFRPWSAATVCAPLAPGVYQMRLDHHACPVCGTYNGRQAIKIKEAASDGRVIEISRRLCHAAGGDDRRRNHRKCRENPRGPKTPPVTLFSNFFQ